MEINEKGPWFILAEPTIKKMELSSKLNIPLHFSPDDCRIFGNFLKDMASSLDKLWKHEGLKK